MAGIETALTYDLGTDQDYAFTIYTTSAETVVRDVSSYTFSFLVKRKATDADVDALVTKTSSSGIAISGAFDDDPDTNTQVTTVSIADTDTDAHHPGTYRWELKRTNAGSESRIGYGTVVFRQTLHRT